MYNQNQDMADLEQQLQQGKVRGRELQGRLAQLNNVKVQRLRKLTEKPQHRGVGKVRREATTPSPPPGTPGCQGSVECVCAVVAGPGCDCVRL